MMKQSMKLGVLGTSTVGRALAAKLSEHGHAVTLGTRDVAATLAKTAPDAFGNPPFSVWRDQHPKIELGTFAQAAAGAELVFNATSGQGSLAALKAAGANNLAGKILVDLANPLDFSKGMPPSLSVCNTDSLGEQIQRAFPAARVVKTLNTVNANLMLAPETLAGAEHTMFLCGNDAGAKQVVSELLRSYGWRDLVDLGDLTGARAMEMILPIWLRAWSVTKTPTFSFKLVR